VNDSDICLSFLPLSHVLERMSGYYTSLYNGVSIAHATSIDTIADEITEVKPHFMVSVPSCTRKSTRVLSMIESEHRQAEDIQLGGGSGRKVSALQLKPSADSRPLGFQHKIADKLVFSKIYEKMGGRLRFSSRAARHSPRR